MKFRQFLSKLQTYAGCNESQHPDNVATQHHALIERDTLTRGTFMKITIDFDVTPEELRQFLGLPNVEGLQEEMLKAAQKQMAESGQTMFNEMVTGAVQPMLAYQQWLQRMMTGNVRPDHADDKGADGKQ
ncbi:MAG: hypothetical protein JJ921_17700 [Pseudomonadales bacterium]|nr:hypothetical protein [Pseudomonadales bacterium]MBO6563413.1 hypothetical protein [Pseudomonadales bacterium]MBO6597938.1 hypothetical protein [Pseudomonadales bacterium]MBO6704183.1 hypothetical protein [Pseudomonadales bacterium]MBO6823040.1 hypothetical protein [Pseudomonadales bacterium]